MYISVRNVPIYFAYFLIHFSCFSLSFFQLVVSFFFVNAFTSLFIYHRHYQHSSQYLLHFSGQVVSSLSFVFQQTFCVSLKDKLSQVANGLLGLILSWISSDLLSIANICSWK